MGKEDLKYSEQEIINLGWEKLDKLLDDRAPSKPRFIWWWFPVLIVLITGSYFVINGISTFGTGERANEQQGTEQLVQPVIDNTKNVSNPVYEERISNALTDSAKALSAHAGPVLSSEADEFLSSATKTKKTSGTNSVVSQYAETNGEKQFVPTETFSVPATDISENILDVKNAQGEERLTVVQEGFLRLKENTSGVDPRQTKVEGEDDTLSKSQEGNTIEVPKKSARPRVTVQADDLGGDTEAILETKDVVEEEGDFTETNLSGEKLEDRNADEVAAVVGDLAQPEGGEEEDFNELTAEGAEEGEGSTDVKSLNKEMVSGALFGEVGLVSNGLENLGFGGGLQYKTPLGERGSWALGLQLSSIKEPFGQSVNYESALNDSVDVIINGLSQKVSIFELSVPATYQYELTSKSEVVIGIVGAYQKMTETSGFSADDFQAIDNNGGPVGTNTLIPAISDLLPDDQFSIASRIGLNQTLTQRFMLSGNLTKTFNTGNNFLNYTPTQIGLAVRLKLTDQ